ncbi:MAG: hypothetical protein JSS72_07280 [Armatimonadetes bacterium]|nr:hypothetical protein [Armatimonadota bacterium]
MNIRTSAISILAAVAVVGCQSGSTSGDTAGAKGGSAASTEAKVAPVDLASLTAETLMPFQEGNQWVYEVETTIQAGNNRRTNQANLTYKIVKVEKDGDGTLATFEIYNGDKLADKQVWREDAKGIYQVAMGQDLKKYTSPQPMILFPVKEGDTFSWKGTGLVPTGKTGPIEAQNHVLGSQEVDTRMGRLAGVAIESTSNFSFMASPGKGKPEQLVKGKTDGTVWLAPKLGLIRSAQRIMAGQVGFAQTLRLKSFTGKQ